VHFTTLKYVISRGKYISSDWSNHNQNGDIFAYMWWNLSTENARRLNSVVQEVI